MPRDASRPPLQRLHVRLLKPDVTRVDGALEDSRALNSYEIRHGLGFTGRLYVLPPKQATPPWLRFVQTGVARRLERMTNRTNAAVLVVRRNGRIFAFTFGHGRHLLKSSSLVPDFGLKTALNGLRYDSLRSVDSFTLEEQTVHTRSQASRASGIETFGLDSGRDILRAVTGSPRPDISLQTLSGGEDSLAISKHVDFDGLGTLCDELLALYQRNAYQDHFAWVDNIRQVRDPVELDRLDNALLRDLRRDRNHEAYLAPPEPIDWSRNDGFTYTRRREPTEQDLSLDHYLAQTERAALGVAQLKRDKVFVHVDGMPQPVDSWPVYRCLVLEHADGDRRFVLINATWFEVNRDFLTQIRETIARITLSPLAFPDVRRQANGRLEPEADYNRRLGAALPEAAVLDGQLARCQATSSGIEPCDLLTEDRDLIHVKHRKGGSSDLSHLFAQARVSAEALVGDEGYRQGVRTLLNAINDGWEDRVPLDRPAAGAYTVVFAILGANERPGEGLPFFSQLNLARTSAALLNLGFRVAIRGVQITDA